MKRFFMTSALSALALSHGANATTISTEYLTLVANGGAAPSMPMAATVADATTPLDRLAAPEYEDGYAAPAVNGRPSPRDLSNALSKPQNRKKDSRPLSNLAVAFSQLMASHEIARSPTDSSEPLNLPVSPTDPIAVQTGGVPVMRQSRSQFAGGSGPGDPRQQLNDVTRAFDGSVVYGSDLATQTLLRTNDGTGMLKTAPDGGLPIIGGRRKAGDVRADENKALEGLHVLFVKEHNRLAQELTQGCVTQSLACSGEEVFQGAKALVVAQQNKIFYDEFLPIFLGTDDLTSLVPNKALLSQKNAMFNEFSTAAGRVGHTQVPDTVNSALPGGAVSREKIEDCLFSGTCQSGASLDALIYGSSIQKAQPIDLVVADGLRNGQLPGFGSTFLIDLLATNINRGRDHGLASYGAVRQTLGFSITDETQLLPQNVLDLYNGAPVDLLVALFAEEKKPNEYLGETGKALWALQFESLKPTDGLLQDKMFAGLFDDVSMAGLIAANTDLSVGDFGRSAFLAPVPLPPAGLALLAGLGMLLRLRGAKTRQA